MREPLYALKFTEESGLIGAIAYMSDELELTESHIRMVIEARNLQASGTLAEPRLKWWEPEKYW